MCHIFKFNLDFIVLKSNIVDTVYTLSMYCRLCETHQFGCDRQLMPVRHKMGSASLVEHSIVTQCVCKEGVKGLN